MTTKRVEVPFDSRICHKRPPLLSYLPISRCGRPGYICHSGMTMVSTMETKKNRFNTVDDYLDSIDDPTKRKTLERVRAIIKATVPDAEEHISYQLPAYHHHGALVYFGAWKSHWALYPLSSAMKEAFQSELSAYRLTKGGVQFPWDTRFPQRLVRQLIEKRITENLQAERENTAKKRNSIHCKTTIMEKRISTQKITPNLWFDNQAEDAARFYTSTFKNAQIGRISRYTKDGFEFHGKPEGSVMTVEFIIEGQEFVALNGGPLFQFNESISFIVNCETQEEVDYYWDGLTEGRKELEQPCGWLKDRFGVSWQIVPVALNDMILDPDPAKVSRVTQALFQMKKLDLRILEDAYQNG